MGPKNPVGGAQKIKINMVAAAQLIDEESKNDLLGDNQSHEGEQQTYDCIIWLGDMNYRINGVVGAIMHAMKKNMYEVLIDND